MGAVKRERVLTWDPRFNPIWATSAHPGHVAIDVYDESDPTRSTKLLIRNSDLALFIGKLNFRLDQL